jgi:hypothetical protein
LVTHSQSGLFGWLAGSRSPNAKGIISYEPGFVFPQDEMPAPIPLYRGTQVAGTPVTPSEFVNLVKIPIQVVYGDNIPKLPIPDLVADGRRARQVTSQLFVQTLNSKGGNASVLLLPDVGLYGNSHFMFSDLNSVQRNVGRHRQCDGLGDPTVVEPQRPDGADRAGDSGIGHMVETVVAHEGSTEQAAVDFVSEHYAGDRRAPISPSTSSSSVPG